MLEDRNVQAGDTREKIRQNAELKAVSVVNETAQRTANVGDQNRKKISASIFAEALMAAYLEGRSSAMLDSALREADEAREREVKTAQELLTGHMQQSAQVFTSALVMPLFKIARKAIMWGIGIAVVHAAIVAVLVVLLLKK